MNVYILLRACVKSKIMSNKNEKNAEILGYQQQYLDTQVSPLYTPRNLKRFLFTKGVLE